MNSLPPLLRQLSRAQKILKIVAALDLKVSRHDISIITANLKLCVSAMLGPPAGISQGAKVMLRSLIDEQDDVIDAILKNIDAGTCFLLHKD